MQSLTFVLSLTFVFCVSTETIDGECTCNAVEPCELSIIAVSWSTLYYSIYCPRYTEIVVGWGQPCY